MKIIDAVPKTKVLQIHRGIIMILSVMLSACAMTSTAGRDDLEEAVQGDPNFHIYLCFGQSNMEGDPDKGIPPKYKEYSNDRFQVMAAANMPRTQRIIGNWYQAVPPLVRDWTGLSPADFFGRTLAEEISDPDIRIGVIVVAVGGCAINLFDKDNTEAMAYLNKQESYMKPIAAEYGNNPYQRMVDMAKLAQKDGVIKGILLHQGESGKARGPNYSNGSDNANWGIAVKNIYDNLLADLKLKPNSIPLLAGQVVGNNSAIIRDLPKVMPGVAHVISSEGLTQGKDQWHFSYDGYEQLGVRYGKKMLELNYP
ncbi:MAG: sialate O-acetylesterase [Treponema sp.]|jgi:alpha-L-fucosidase 2|nr:sialate O-acetylesterase [Treponema sp.]